MRRVDQALRLRGPINMTRRCCISSNALFVLLREKLISPSFVLRVSTLMNTRGKSVQSAPMHSGAERGDARRPPLVAAAYFTG